MRIRGYGTALTASEQGARLRARGGALTVAHPVISAFVLSRAVVYAGGIAGALLVARVAAWSTVDPQHLTSSLGSVGNVLAAPSVRWDSLAYLSIAQHGYTDPGSTVFFPLYPMMIAVIGFVIGSDVLAGILISLVSLVVALALLHRLTELELGREVANTTILLLALAPLSFFFTAVYTESLFLALSVGAIYAGRQDHWALAGTLAALASVTRVTGILLIAPLALMALRGYGRLLPRLAWLLSAPAAFAAFLAYLANSGYGWLAPLHNENELYHRSVAGPINTVISAIRAAGDGLRTLVDGVPLFSLSLAGPWTPPFDSILLLAVLIVVVALLAGAFRRLPPPYAVYATLAVLLVIWSPFAPQPLQSFDRYALTIFPLWMVAGSWVVDHPTTRRPLLAIGGALLAYCTFAWASWAFIA